MQASLQSVHHWSLPSRMSCIAGMQLRWLEAKEADCRVLLDNKEYSKLWPQIFEGWFAKFPEHKALFPWPSRPWGSLSRTRITAGWVHCQATKVWSCCISVTLVITGVSTLQKIQSWFRWQKNSARATCCANKQGTALISSLVTLKCQTRSKVKIYSDKFYDMKVKPLVDAEIAAQGSWKGVGKGSWQAGRCARCCLKMRTRTSSK